MQQACTTLLIFSISHSSPFKTPNLAFKLQKAFSISGCHGHLKFANLAKSSHQWQPCVGLWRTGRLPYKSFAAQRNCAGLLQLQGLWYSIILPAVVDHNYKFMLVSVASPGSNHDNRSIEAPYYRTLWGLYLFTLPSQVIDSMPIGLSFAAPFDEAFPS